MADLQKVLEIARGEIGTVEKPAGSNNVKYNTDYYGYVVNGSAYPWCCAFIWWLFQKAEASEDFYGGQKTAYCPTAMSWFKQRNAFYTSAYQVGDIAFFDFKGNGVAAHIGIIEEVNADGTYTTIEGNTSATSDDNGGAVMRRTRYAKNILGVGRPKYRVQELTSINDIVWELSVRELASGGKVVGDVELWMQKLNEDENVYWLARKMVQYLREKRV